jgi:uncharacterized membrane protein YfcA
MATSLALIIPTSIASAQTHASKGAVDWRLILLLGPSIVAGAFVAAAFAHGISAQLLTAMFVLFALHTAWQLMNSDAAKTYRVVADAKQPGLFRITVTGITGGALASLLGLGVSFFSVPILARFVSMQRAIGTAAALCLPMAIAGVIGYLLTETPQICPSGCSGYIYLPAVAAVGITAVLTAPMGAVLTHVLPVPLLRNIFGFFLLLAAANLTYKTLPIMEGTREAQRVIARLLAKPSASAPLAAEAPAWLNSGNDRSYMALAAQYGPRRAFLPLANAASEGVPDAAMFFLSSTPDPDLWRKAMAQPPQLKATEAPEFLFMPVPERAVRPARPITAKRRPEAREKRQRARATGAKPASAELASCRDQTAAGRARRRTNSDQREDCPPPRLIKPAPAAPPPAEFNPFSLLTLPGTEATGLN